MTKKQSFTIRVLDFLGSKKFLYIVLGLFFVQAMWFVLSAGFPMLYDEYVHTKTLELYSSQGNAFNLSQTSSETQTLGDVSRSGSYLYHYLLSFAYTFITAVTSSFYWQIVFLRTLSVVMVFVGLLIFIKTFRSAGFSKKVINCSLLLVICLPIFTYVSAHISYDNMIFLVGSCFFYYGSKLVSRKNVEISDVCTFLSFGLLGSLVKSAFMPIFFIGVFVVVSDALVLRKEVNFLGAKKGGLKHALKAIFTIIFLIVSLCLFTERYVNNYRQYGQIDPQCKKVQLEYDCNQQPIIKRNLKARERQKVDPRETKNYFYYMKDIFLPHMIEDIGSVSVGRIHNTISQQAGFDSPQRFGAKPLSFFITILWILFIISAAVLVRVNHRVYKNKTIIFFGVSLVGYLFILSYIVLFSSYKQLGVPYAVQPRYFLLFVPFIAALIAQSFSIIIHKRTLKLGIFLLIIILMTQGGGVITYLVSSEKNWYWQGETIINTNIYARDVLSPFISGAEDVDRYFKKANE